MRNLALAAASLVLACALLEGALGLAGVVPALVREDPFVGFAGRVPLFIELLLLFIVCLRLLSLGSQVNL